MLVNFARTIFLYVVVTFIMRILGKKQIGQLETSEFVVVLLLSELASIPMQDVDIPLMNSIVPIVTLLCLELALSAASLKVKWLRNLLQGRPVIIVSHGKILPDALRSTRFNLDEVMEELRMAGYSDIRDVEYAVLENNGNFSVIPSAVGKTPSASDLNLKTSPSAMAYIVVNDGKVDKQALLAAGIDNAKLNGLLRKHKISSPEKLFFATYDSNGEFYFQLKEEGSL